MPMRYAPNTYLDPEVATVMREAFNSAWDTVQSSGNPELLDGKAEWARETLGLRIIDMAQQGERDASKLRDDALAFLAQAKPVDG
jgi:hypothetical protein